MHADVIRVRVEVAVVPVRDDDLRSFGTDQPDQPLHRLVQWGVREVVRSMVDVGVGHPGIVVAEQVHDVVSDGLGAGLELAHAHAVQIGADLRGVHRGVEDVAGLTTGAAHEHGVHTLVVVPSDRRAPLRCLVVRVRVNGQDGERVPVAVDGPIAAAEMVEIVGSCHRR